MSCGQAWHITWHGLNLRCVATVRLLLYHSYERFIPPIQRTLERLKGGGRGT